MNLRQLSQYKNVTNVVMVTDRPIVTMGDYWETIGWELNATLTFERGCP